LLIGRFRSRRFSATRIIFIADLVFATRGYSSINWLDDKRGVDTCPSDTGRWTALTAVLTCYNAAPDADQGRERPARRPRPHAPPLDPGVLGRTQSGRSGQRGAPAPVHPARHARAAPRQRGAGRQGAHLRTGTTDARRRGPPGAGRRGEWGRSGRTR